MLLQSSAEAVKAAGVTIEDIDAFWLGTMGSGVSGLTLSRPLKIDYKPVTRLENMCATGSEAFRNACYAVASGAFDVAMAIGVEKLKDSGYSGLASGTIPNDGTLPTLTAPASFSLLAPAYAKKYGVDDAEMKDVLTRIAWKNHHNGALNPRAQFRKEVAEGHHRLLAARRRPARHLRLLGRERRLGRRRHRPGRGRPQVHRQADLREGAVVRGRPGRRPHRPELRLHVVPRGRAVGRGRLRPGRHQQPAAPSWPWPRSTTASRPPSWC